MERETEGSVYRLIEGRGAGEVVLLVCCSNREDNSIKVNHD